MKKLIILITMILSMTAGAFGMTNGNVLGRLFRGDVMSERIGMITLAAVFAGEMESVTNFTSQLAGVKFLSIYGGSGLGVLIKDKQVYVGGVAEFDWNGRPVPKIVLAKYSKAKDPSQSELAFYGVHIKDFQVGGKVTTHSEESDDQTYTVQDVDIRRMKKAVLKRDEKIDSYSIDANWEWNIQLYGLDEGLRRTFKEHPECDLGE